MASDQKKGALKQKGSKTRERHKEKSEGFLTNVTETRKKKRATRKGARRQTRMQGINIRK